MPCTREVSGYLAIMVDGILVNEFMHMCNRETSPIPEVGGFLLGRYLPKPFLCLHMWMPHR